MDNNSVETYIKPYQFSAFADYIIQTHPSYEEWNANNYINLYGIDNGSHVVDYCTGSVFGLLPLLTVINRADEIDNDKEKLFEFITIGLKNNKKFYFNLDHFYIEGYEEYKKTHIVHDILLIDYESEHYICIENINGFLKKVQINKTDLLTGFAENTDRCVLELSPNYDFSYHFDLSRFMTMINDYVNSYDINDHNDVYFYNIGFVSKDFYSNRLCDKTLYGINIYDFIIEGINIAIKNKAMADYRHIYILYEKNQNMVGKLEFMKKRKIINMNVDSLIERINEIAKELKQLIYRVIMYDTSLNEAIMKGMDEKLLCIKKKEFEIYNDILKLN